MRKFLSFGIIIFLGLVLILPIIISKRKSIQRMPEPKITRPPAVAGSFYPEEKEELNHLLTSLINQSEKIPVEGNLKILIVPHAGIQYSGPTAAAGFKQVEGKNYRRVIILGVSHRAWFDHAAVFAQGQWETPLGKVEVDQNLAKNLLDENKRIIADYSPHTLEHSLEVELIFLQKVLKNFKIVPVLVSQTDQELINNLAQKIAQNIDEQTLLVVSTDLSHYPPWEVAKKVDNQTIEAILTGDPEKFSQTIFQLESGGFPGLETAICGHEAVKVALRVGQILKVNWQKIKYENSGDTAGEKSQVVGYAAIGGWSKNSSSTNYLDKDARQEALKIARKTLEEYLTNGKIPSISFKNPQLSQPLGCFVTLRKHGELRGCIGEFEPKDPLWKVIQRMAIAAATEDPRFSPVSAEELKDIKIEISVMTPKRKIDDWRQIELGKHGVVVQKGFRSGTFLPQVAQETGWSLEEFLSQLCWQKAGLPPDCYKDPSVNLYVFEAQVFEEE